MDTVMYNEGQVFLRNLEAIMKGFQDKTGYAVTALGIEHMRLPSYSGKNQDYIYTNNLDMEAYSPTCSFKTKYNPEYKIKSEKKRQNYVKNAGINTRHYGSGKKLVVKRIEKRNSSSGK